MPRPRPRPRPRPAVSNPGRLIDAARAAADAEHDLDRTARLRPPMRVPPETHIGDAVGLTRQAAQ